MKITISRVERAVLVGFFAVPFTFAIGCGAGDEMTVAEFCERKAENECGKAGSLGVAESCLVDPETGCKPVRLAACTTWATGIQTQSGTTRPFNQEKAGECLNKTAEVYKKSPIVPMDTDALAALCQRVFSGNKKTGDACTTDYECGGNAVCDFQVCANKVTLAKGAFCGTVPGAACGPGLYCAVPAGQSLAMCIDRETTGDACDEAILCVETLRCLATTSTCGPRVGFAQPCTSNADCATTAPYCDPYNGNICTSGFIPAPQTPECTAFGAAASAASST